MSKTPWMQFYPSDWLAATNGLTPAERGIYITLISLMYDKGGPLDRDDARLARQCGCPKAAFKKALTVLIEDGKITERDGAISNERTEKELVARQNRSENGTTLAKKRWRAQKGKNQQNQGPPDAVRNAPRNASQNQNQNQIHTVPKGTACTRAPDSSDHKPDMKFAVRCMDAAKLTPLDRHGQARTAERWRELAEHANVPAAEVIETVRGVTARKRDGPARSLAYFNQPVADMIANYHQPLPEGNAHAGHRNNGREETDIDRLLKFAAEERAAAGSSSPFGEGGDYSTTDLPQGQEPFGDSGGHSRTGGGDVVDIPKTQGNGG